jgi:hypothetical protein
MILYHYSNVPAKFYLDYGVNDLVGSKGPSVSLLTDKGSNTIPTYGNNQGMLLRT